MVVVTNSTKAYKFLELFECIYYQEVRRRGADSSFSRLLYCYRC